MPEVIPYVLWSWVAVTLLLFWRLPPARAAAISLVGGWLFLPTARFADDVAGVEFPFWIMPACLPSDVWTTKARVIGVSLLVGVMAFDPSAWRKFRPSWFDLPILAWCVVPPASGLANGVPPIEWITSTAYQVCAWGVPYLAGRLYFADPAGMSILARAIIGGGVVYVPFCVVENVMGPIVYHSFYGDQPFRFIGATRYLGYRPVVLMEDGNQLGIWMASAALVAAWLWRSGQLSTFWRMPGSFVASLLVTVSVATQSAGAVILLVAGLVGIELVWRVDRRWPIIVALCLPLVFVGARAANLFDAKALATRTPLGRWLAEGSIKLDRKSFGWRLRVEERAATYALQRPWLGWSRWDWWRGVSRDERPWGLFSLTVGMYGAVGLAALAGVFVAPVASFLAFGPPRLWINPSRASAAAIAWALGLNGLDAILNPALLLIFVAGSGALIGARVHAKASTDWVRLARARLGSTL